MVPLIVILPGLLALAVLPHRVFPTKIAYDSTPAQKLEYVKSEIAAGHIAGESAKDPQALTKDMVGQDEVLPVMLARYCGTGLLGLGITALIAGFMSGMAGNVTAFSTVWTYDIYRAQIKKNASDQHYVTMGRWCTILGVIISIGTAYLCLQAAGIMDYVQALFSFFIAPLFATVLLGMLWKRATRSAGFWGLLAGTVSSVGMWAWVQLDPGAIRFIALSPDAKPMAENMYRALWCFLVNVIVTVVVSLMTAPKPEAELVGLVRGCTEIPTEKDYPWYKRSLFWGALLAVAFVAVNIIFW